MRLAAVIAALLAALAAAVPSGAAAFRPEPSLGDPPMTPATISDGTGALVWQAADGTLRILRDDQRTEDAAITPAPPAGCRPDVVGGGALVVRCDGTTTWNDRFFLLDVPAGTLSEDAATRAASGELAEDRVATPLAVGTRAMAFSVASFIPNSDGGFTSTISRVSGHALGIDAPLDSVPDLDQAKGWRRLCPGLHRQTYVSKGGRGAWPAVYRAPYLLERDPASGQLWVSRCGLKGRKLIGVTAGPLDDVVLRARYVALVADGGRALVVRWLDGRRWVYQRLAAAGGLRIAAATDRRIVLSTGDGHAKLLELT